MGFLNKVLSREKEAEAEEAEAEEAGVADDLPVSEALDADMAETLLDPGLTGPSDEADILAQYADMADGAPAAEVPIAEALIAEVPIAEPVETEAESGGDDLMDIFTSEEEDDADMSAMTDDLEELDLHSLLAEAIDVAAELRAYVEGG